MSKNIFKFLSRKLASRLLLLITILSITIVSVRILSQFSWSGFGEDSNKSISTEETIKDGKFITTKKITLIHEESAKTLWDWLNLAGTLAIPIVLYLFQVSEQRLADKRVEVEKEQAEKLAQNEKNIAESNLREEAFQIYIDRMSEILINRTSQYELFSDEYKDNSVKDIVRIRTITILRRLENDNERKNRIFNFLDDAELLKFLFKNTNLSGINLSNLNLPNINFTGSNLSGANLSGANLNEANLFRGNFTNTNLSNANLKNSCLQDTKFINANLTNAILENAKTWSFSINDEDEVELNASINISCVIDENGDQDITYDEPEFYSTDFKGAILIKTDLKFANLIGANNLTPEQLKKAKNWDEAIYGDELSKLLGSPIKLQTILDEIELEGKDVKKLIGYQVLITNDINRERKIISIGQISGFTELNGYVGCVNVKTSSGEQLDELSPGAVYVYQNQQTS